MPVSVHINHVIIASRGVTVETPMPASPCHRAPRRCLRLTLGVRDSAASRRGLHQNRACSCYRRQYSKKVVRCLASLATRAAFEQFYAAFSRLIPVSEALSRISVRLSTRSGRYLMAPTAAGRPPRRSDTKVSKLAGVNLHSVRRFAPQSGSSVSAAAAVLVSVLLAADGGACRRRGPRHLWTPPAHCR